MSDTHQHDFIKEGDRAKSSASAGDVPHRSYTPLAERMRPASLAEIIGQTHLTNADALLPTLLKSGQFSSLLFYGPPGSGKTTLALLAARETGMHLVRLNAVLSNVAEMREVLSQARFAAERILLFIDEIHRFNKSQQDLLLPDVEAGKVTLVGATTHNPSHSVIAPLLSRSHLFTLSPIEPEEMITLLEKALEDTEKGLGNRKQQASADVFEAIARIADGDLRRALNALETISQQAPMNGAITMDHIQLYARERHIRYDADEDEHYNTISAFIKSIRGGDPDAAVYWLAKMLIGGEDPLFIARRLVILASEDIGLADSRALMVATSTYTACERVGLPEAELNLAHATLFLTLAPKSNSSTTALQAAKEAIQRGPIQKVPHHLRDAHHALAQQMGHGKDYHYSHDYPEAISGQEYMENPLTLYHPTQNGAESTLSERLEHWRTLKRKVQNEK